MKCLQKKPEDRYQSIAELADALAPIAGAGASTSAAMIARLSGRQAAVAAPPPTAQQPVSAPPPVTQPAPMPGFVPVAPTQPVMHHGLPATASARMPIGVGEAQGTPGSKMWLWGLIGGAAMIAIVAIIALTRGDPEAEVAREAGKPDKPIAIAEVPGKEVGKGSGSASTIEVEAALKFLDQAYAQQNNNQPGTREEALRFLDKMYAQQLASKADAQDPTAVYAVHVGDAVAAGQLEGPRDALVTIVVAFDLACPFCAKLSPTISELIAQYPNKVRAVYMNMVVHPTVQTAHRYGCAAAKQGKFIAFERAFYEGPFQKYRDAGGKNPDILDQRGIQPLASTLGLDIVKLANDANFCAERIEADQIELRRFKVSGTPTMFINGKYVGGALPKEQLEKLVVEQLKIAEASGVPAARYYEQEIVGKGLRELRSAPTKPPTRDDAVAYLVEAYRTQMAQEAARDAETLDPDAVFAVDIAPAVAAKQVLGGPAAVTVVVISDFVCPYCRKVDAVLHDLYGEYAGQLRIVFMHMIVHPDTATVGHQYACAAGLQGKFAAFAELWWKNSFDPYAASSGRDKSIFSEAKVLGYAGRLGVSMSRLKADANGDECRSRIAGDQAEARKFKVSGTPTMFINGKVIPGFVQKDAMKTLIDEQLKRVEQSGTPAAEYYDREVFAKGLRQFRAKSSKP
jgi:protein-disulfide isomerase